eukprot:scaffold10670_cov72-Skeletonema_marinoi.AAC.3
MYCSRLTSSIASAALLVLCTHCISASAFLFAPNKSHVHRSLSNINHLHNDDSFCTATSCCHLSSARSCCCRRRRNAKLIKGTTTELSAVQFAAVGATVANFYKTSPFTAGFITASTRAAIADSIAQRLDLCNDEFDMKRCFAMVLYSGVILGLCCELMFNHIFPVIFAGETNPLVLAVKMALFDVIINAPLIWLPPAYIVQALAYRFPKREAIQRYITDVKQNGLLKKYWSLWLPASLTNFLFVPAHFRVAFVAAVGFFWMIVLSAVANENNGELEVEICPIDCPQEPEPKMDYPRAME